MNLIMPPLLKKGDTVGIIAPSAGLAAIMPHRLDNAIKFLKSQGYKVKEFPCTRKIRDWESAPAEERARELMDAFLDKEVKAIVCEIGGNTSNKILKYLDFEKIRENPKIFCGYSDISVLHYALNKKSGLITFYGPCAMTQFGEYPRPLGHTLNYFNKAIVEGRIGEVSPSESWTDEVLDWGEKKDLERPRKMKENKGYEWLRNGKAEGIILGGCISALIHLLGTEYWPSHKNSILFLETSEGESDFTKGKSLALIDSQLCHLGTSGIFEEIRGLIIGRPFGYDEEEIEKFKRVILENTKNYNFPILFGVDIGHSDPQITVPLGKMVSINSNENSFKFV